MNYIYFTGDLHGDIDVRKLKFFKDQGILKEGDVIIIAGDFGLTWKGQWEATCEYWLNWIEEYIKCDVLFVCGNHEDFDKLYQYPFESKYGNQVRELRKNIFHLIRGNIYKILGNRVFAFGGANSIDKAYRVEGTSWWPQEIPTKEEEDHGIESLESVNYKVDLVVTHEAPINVLSHHQHDIEYSLKKYLRYLKDQISFKKWFFGHHHIDKLYEIDGKFYQGTYQDFYREEEIITKQIEEIK